MRQLEEKLDEWLVKKAPFQIPENARLGIVKAMPWVTVVGGVLMLAAAWWLWQAAVAVSNLANWANSLSAAYGGSYVSAPTLGFMIWVALALLVVQAVLFFMAFPALQERQKKGWNLLFWVALLNIAEAVVQVIGYSNAGYLLSSLLGSVIGLYVLFQIRGHYTGVAKPAGGASPTMQMPKETPPSAPTPPSDKQE